MDENLGKKAHELHQKIVDREAKRRMLYADIMHDLAQMHDEGLYKAYLGDEEAEWAGYLAETDIYFTRNQVKDFIRIYRKYSGELGLSRYEYTYLPKSRLIDLIPIVTKENYGEWLTKASTLTSRDWRIEVRQAKALPTEEDDHQCDMVEYEVCRVCGKKHRKYEETESME